MKRLIDILGSLAALLLLAPVMILAALAIALESPGPVIFRQTRIGLNGREFGMYKLRSMVRDAAARGAYWTSQDDPRITRVGRFIRLTSIDELPQLVNVIRGEMSLVGPRPDVPQQRAQYTDGQWSERCSMLPGLTGLAQVELRSTGTEAERLALDLTYVRTHSLALDLRIMWRTLGRLTGKGGN
jgi:lipopolysaccharide/colanic/teichoic acid biosynthesis glycosyltransferase